MSHESLRGEAYVLNSRLRNPATYSVILAAAGDLKGYVKGSLKETKSLNYARILLSNSLSYEERMTLGQRVAKEAQDRLDQNQNDRVAKSALRFGNRMIREANTEREFFLRYHS